MTFEQALEIAARVHAGQPDKVGEPVLLHVIRVVVAVSAEARVVASLHDALEDKRVSEDQLRDAGIRREDLEALRLLDKAGRPDDEYQDYIEEIAAAEGEAGCLAREVKRADLRDNLGRMTDELRAKRPDLEPKYRRALERLNAAGA
jgi:hypothetical protein